MKSIVIFFLGVLLCAQALEWPKVRKLKASRSIIKDPESRIIGGDVAEWGQFPYQAIAVAEDNGTTGAVLISPSAVLTAAHFVASHDKFEVHLGAHVLMNVEEPGRVIVKVKDFILHDGFQFGVNFDYDIAILRFAEPITGNSFKPIRLPAWSQENTTFADMTAIASGWGTIDDMQVYYIGELRYVEVRVTSLEECQADWGNEVVTDINLCASTNYGTAGICVGDSGGPLALTEEDGEPTLVGTAIFGHPFGCEQDAPNVYARVSKYLTWIANNVPDVNIRP